MRRTYWMGLALAIAGLLVLPAAAFGAGEASLTQLKEAKQVLKDGLAYTNEGVNNTWVIVAAILVMFMQAGFLLLEVGFSRMKNVGRRGGEDPRQLLDRLARLLGGRASRSRLAARRLVRR